MRDPERHYQQHKHETTPEWGEHECGAEALILRRIQRQEQRINTLSRSDYDETDAIAIIREEINALKVIFARMP